MTRHTLSAVVEPVPGYELPLVLAVIREDVREVSGPAIDLELRGATWPTGERVTDARLIDAARNWVDGHQVEILNEIGW